MLADKAYDINALRAAADQKEAWANIPAKSNRKDSCAFCGWVYRQRNLVERFFNKLKQFGGIATWHDKNPLNFLAAIKIVAAYLDQSVMSLPPSTTLADSFWDRFPMAPHSADIVDSWASTIVQ